MRFFTPALPAALLLGALALPAAAATRNVPTATYPTIQSAVDASQPGDTVRVNSGSYPEQVVIKTSNLMILGANGATLDGASFTTPSSTTIGFDITFSASSVTVIGFTVQNYKTGIAADGPNADIENNTFNQNAAFGAFLNGTAADFEHNTITASGSVSTLTGIGISDFSYGASIEHNDISGSGDTGIGVSAQVPAGSIGKPLPSEISHNTVTDSGIVGIGLSDATGQTVDHNTTTGSGYAGISLQNFTSGCTISHNEMNVNKYDGFVTDGGITGCTIDHNDADDNVNDGFDITAGDTSNVFTHDEAEGNANLDAEDPNGGNTWTHDQFGTSNPLKLGQN